MTTLQLGQSGVRIPAGEGDITLLKTFRYDQSCPYSVEVKNERSYDSPPLT